MDDYDESIITGSSVTAIASLLLMACSTGVEEPDQERPIKHWPGRIWLYAGRRTAAEKASKRKRKAVLEEF